MSALILLASSISVMPDFRKLFRLRYEFPRILADFRRMSASASSLIARILYRIGSASTSSGVAYFIYGFRNMNGTLPSTPQRPSIDNLRETSLNEKEGPSLSFHL